MPVEMVNVGFGNAVASGRVVAVVRADASPSRRMIEAALAQDRLVDATAGRRTRSIIITDSNHVLLSHLQPSTVASKISGSPMDADATGPEEVAR